MACNRLMPDAILALNAGSSSIKFALYEVAAGRSLTLASHGQIDGIGTAPHFAARDAAGETIDDRSIEGGATASHEALLSDLLGWIDRHLGGDALIAAGHRVVHGGREFTAPVRLTDHVLQALDALTPLVPLHQPHSLAPVRALLALRPALAQVACFDTAFHSTMPLVATEFALPRRYFAAGVRRYGFHGLSYEYIARTLRDIDPVLAAGRVIVAHLGNGASLCAMRDGRSVETSMSFTALDGLVMGTRCGTIDPGVLLYMLHEEHLSASDIEHLLYKQSGLLGVSGVSGDMRELIASDTTAAREAIALFVYRIVRAIGGILGALGGLDGLVFTAGIGEHAAEIRAAVCERLHWLGVDLDPAANARHANLISRAGSLVAARVIPTNEELMIAQHTADLLMA